MLEDRSLIRRLNQGSMQALRRIYEKYKEDLFTIAVSLIADKPLAEDCLQDVFVHLAEAAGTINVHNNLKGYLAGAVVNRARDRLRRESRQIDCPVDELQLEELAPRPDEQVISDEQMSALMRAIAKLPIEQKEVFVLHMQGPMSFRQIAGQQRVSIRTAHSRYRYAINKLRVLLNKANVV
jgi:RNA polymerase sigma factor (sigma-70 family)